MSNQHTGRNAPCPCGSRKKFKNCCLRKQNQSQNREMEPIPDQTRPMSDELANLLQQHLDDRRKETGYPPAAEDMLFKNLLGEHVEHSIVEAMQAAGIDPALVFAFEKTGLLVSEDNLALLSERDLSQWTEAVDEYRSADDGGSPIVDCDCPICQMMAEGSSGATTIHLDGPPCRWRAIQMNRGGSPRILRHHLADRTVAVGIGEPP